jgi:hypothetical protein
MLTRCSTPAMQMVVLICQVMADVSCSKRHDATWQGFVALRVCRGHVSN